MLEVARTGRQFGKYLLVRQIATGGMAEVYLARQTGPGGFEKQCVIKRMLPQLAIDKAFVQMFLDEARIAAHLAHPNIVQVYDFGQEGSDYFIAMEYVRGVDLNQLQLAASGGASSARLPAAIALRIVAAVAEGLDHAHRASDSRGQPLGLVHRDVTPSNVMISYDGVAKILDFGIAKASARVSRTEVGVIKGKIPYMSPEQVQGEPLDGRSDIFSLGTLLYELTVGEKPFDGTNPAEISLKILHDDPRPPELLVDGFPPELSAVILRALAKRPADRYESARELHLALEEVTARLGARATSHDVAAYVTSAIPPRTDDEAGSGAPESPEATDPTVAMSRQALASDRVSSPVAKMTTATTASNGAAPIGGDDEPPQPVVGDLGIPAGAPDVRRNLGGGGGGTKYIILFLVIAVAVGFWYLRTKMDKPEPSTIKPDPTATTAPTAETPKPAEAPKAVESPKGAEAPKAAEGPKAVEAPKPAEAPKVEPLKPAEPATAPPVEKPAATATKPKKHHSSSSSKSKPSGSPSLPRLPSPPPTED